MDTKMNTEPDTVIFDITPMANFLARACTAAQVGLPARAAHISFETPEHMWRVLTEKRWAILRTMTGAGAIGVRELARRVGRDVKAVHTDVTALLEAGVIDRTANSKLLFPYRHVKVQFALDDMAANAAPAVPATLRPSAAPRAQRVRQAAQHTPGVCVSMA